MLEAVRDQVGRGLSVVWVTQEPEELAAAGRCLELSETASSGVRPDPLAIGQFGTWVAGDIPQASTSEDTPALWIRVHPSRGGDGLQIATRRTILIQVSARGVTALEGRNGSGKSVLLGAVAGLRTLAQVQVEWKQTQADRPILAGQFPELEIFAETVAEEATYAAVSRGMAREEAQTRAANQFEFLGLGGRAFLGRRSWELSAGERRLTQVVGALIAPASLILLDEPTCGLDPWRRSRLASVVRERAREVPLLVASQDRHWLGSIAAQRFPLGAEGSEMATFGKKTG